MNIFYEKSFWLLVVALVSFLGFFLAFFYKMFTDKLELQLDLLTAKMDKSIKEQIESRMNYLPTQSELTEMNRKLSSINDVKKELESFKQELESFKRHETRNSESTQILLRRLLEKIDVHTKEEPDFLLRMMGYGEK